MKPTTTLMDLSQARSMWNELGRCSSCNKIAVMQYENVGLPGPILISPMYISGYGGKENTIMPPVEYRSENIVRVCLNCHVLYDSFE